MDLRSVQPKEKCIDGCAFFCNREHGLSFEKIEILLSPGSKRIVAACIALVGSVLFAAAHPVKEPYAPGLGEFMTATQLRHAKLWFAGKENNWDLAAYEIDEIAEGLEDAEKQFPTHDGIPVADMIKANIDPAVVELRTAVGAKSSTKFAVGAIGFLS